MDCAATHRAVISAPVPRATGITLTPVPAKILMSAMPMEEIFASEVSV